MTNAEWTGLNRFNYCLNQSILFGFVFAPVFEVIIKKDQGAVGRVKGFDKKSMTTMASKAGDIPLASFLISSVASVNIRIPPN